MPRRPVLALIAGVAGLVLLAGLPQAIPVGGAQYLGSYTWRIADPAFGGLSGLELGADGLAFTAISDHGSLLTGRLIRNAAGAVSGTAEVRLSALRDTDDHPLRGLDSDAEGLAAAPDGRFFVSFEARHRVWAYAGADAAAEPLPVDPAFARFQRNSGLEALAVDDAGRLYTLPERSGAWDRAFPVYRWDGEAWSQPFDLPRDGGYLPVAADFGPDGRLYLLERDFRGLLGFNARVSRFEIGETGAGPREVLLETTRLFQNDFEGLAVWQDEGGAIRLTLLSDDNFVPVLSTEFADYRLSGRPRP